MLTNNLGHILEVDSAETIWDKVSEEVITFDQFMDIMESNLLVGVSREAGTKVDELCWTLSQLLYMERVASISDSEVEAEKKTRRQFTNTDRFRLWKVGF